MKLINKIDNIKKLAKLLFSIKKDYQSWEQDMKNKGFL